MGGAMSNPWEYREIMKAAFKVNETRTVDEVVKEHEARHEEGRRKSKSKTRANTAVDTTGTPVAPQMSSIPQSKMDDLRALLAAAGPKPEPPALVASTPDE